MFNERSKGTILVFLKSFFFRKIRLTKKKLSRINPDSRMLPITYVI